jgi:hypothetical protein
MSIDTGIDADQLSGIETISKDEVETILNDPEFWAYLESQLDPETKQDSDSEQSVPREVQELFLEHPGKAIAGAFKNLYEKLYLGRSTPGHGYGTLVEFATRDSRDTNRRKIDGLYTVSTMPSGETRYSHTMDDSTGHRYTFIASEGGELVILTEGDMGDGFETYEVTDKVIMDIAIRSYFDTALNAITEVLKRTDIERKIADHDAKKRLLELRSMTDPYLEHLTLAS